jgi:hypothetical protein
MFGCTEICFLLPGWGKENERFGKREESFMPSSQHRRIWISSDLR